MGRSLKKGPFIADSLLKKVEKQNTDNDKSVIKTCLLYTSDAADE